MAELLWLSSLNAGYYFGTWLNVGATRSWIDAVQSNNASDVDDSPIFDGFTFKAKYIF